ncbi:Extracellular aldonolactonase protein [Colletotrichum sp. SAR 10_96]|nr:Extracellular aldonolactonase protein [Colletotrichum sp. SAR 10_96]
MRFSLLFASLAVAVAAANQTAANIYVSSYGGYVFSINVANDSSLSLKDSNTACGPSGAWLTWDSERRMLYCLDEGVFAANGSLSSYSTSSTGSLTLEERRKIPSGPSAAVLWGSGAQKTLGISHYNGSAVTVWNTQENGVVTPAEQLFFYKDDPGSNPRQTTPEQHHIVLDPTGQFVVVPAFGLDELQVFKISGSSIQQLESTRVASGSGPRHGVFWSPNGPNQTENLYFLLLAELTSALTTYKVSYSDTGMSFSEVDVTTSYGTAPVPMGNYAAEIAVSPDNRFVVVSNRNGTAIAHDSLNYGSGVTEFWDRLSSFEPMSNGTLVLKQMVLAGGRYPRNFAFNKVGDRVAIALQSQQRVVIAELIIETGVFGDILSNITVIGEPTCVVWDD